MTAWDKNALWDAFSTIWKSHGPISANKYDALSATIPDAPSRNTLARQLGISWRELVKQVSELTDVHFDNKPGSKGPCRPPTGLGPGTFSEITEEELQLPAKYSRFSGKKGTSDIEFRCIGDRVITISDAITASGADTSKWELSDWSDSHWSTSMKLRKRVGTDKDGSSLIEHIPVIVQHHRFALKWRPIVPDPFKIALKNVKSTIPALKFPAKFTTPRPKTQYALELANYDCHIGKLAWVKETLQGNMDSKIAAKWVMDAVSKELEYSKGFKISKIYYIIGQDLLHTENYEGTTPLGRHILDIDTRLPKIIQRTIESTISAISLCLSHAPTEILWVPGNHDMHASYWLTQVVKQAFSGRKHLTVDDGPSWKKCRLWGSLLVGYTHDVSGRKRAASINQLPYFWPAEWSASRFRELHAGHKHKKEEEKFLPVYTVGGTIVRQIPGLTLTDAWHYHEAFTDAVPAGEAFIWSKDDGVVNHFTCNLKY